MENGHVFAETETATAVKGNLTRRFLAFILDAAIAGAAGAVVGLLTTSSLGAAVSAGYWLLRDGLEFDFMHYRSLGKQLLNLHLLRLDGQSMDIETSIRRNWMFALGGLSQMGLWHGAMGIMLSTAGAALTLYEAYRVLTAKDGRRWGDEQAGVVVIEAH